MKKDGSHYGGNFMNIVISNKKADADVYFIRNTDKFFCNDKVNDDVKGIFNHLQSNNDISSKKYEISYYNDINSLNKYIFVGLGNEVDFEVVRRAMSELIKFLYKKSVESISIKLDSRINNSDYIKTIAESAILSSYNYDDYLTSKKEFYLKKIYIDVNETNENLDSINEGISLANATNIARDLVNEPANIQTPEKLANEVMSLSKEHGFEAEILDEKDIINLNMQSFYEVAKGSINKPKLIVMRYYGDKDDSEVIGLIGKGVTYDSGGLNLKSGSRFITMKHDMAGGATVIGAMCAIAKQKLKKNVVAVVAACENLISNTAYKPGDIIGSMAGKTILITSTDAEGRLTMIDAITYAIRKENVNKIIDIATLTGASRRMFGDYASSVMCNDDEFYKVFEKASKAVGELVCRVPEIEDAVSSIKGEISDYVNSAASETCGMITASLFIREFVENKPWIHIDAAGPCWLERSMYYQPKGGSGWGTRTLYQTVKNMTM